MRPQRWQQQVQKHCTGDLVVSWQSSICTGASRAIGSTHQLQRRQVQLCYSGHLVWPLTHTAHDAQLTQRCCSCWQASSYHSCACAGRCTCTGSQRKHFSGCLNLFTESDAQVQVQLYWVHMQQYMQLLILALTFVTPSWNCMTATTSSSCPNSCRMFFATFSAMSTSLRMSATQHTAHYHNRLTGLGIVLLQQPAICSRKQSKCRVCKLLDKGVSSCRTSCSAAPPARVPIETAKPPSSNCSVGTGVASQPGMKQQQKIALDRSRPGML
jgi:hypothetical protein